MSNSNNAKNPKNARQPGKKLDAAAAQNLRQQMRDQVANLSDEELSRVAGGAFSTLTTIGAVVVMGIPDLPGNQ